MRPWRRAQDTARVRFAWPTLRRRTRPCQRFKTSLTQHDLVSRVQLPAAPASPAASAPASAVPQITTEMVDALVGMALGAFLRGGQGGLALAHVVDVGPEGLRKPTPALAVGFAYTLPPLQERRRSRGTRQTTAPTPSADHPPPASTRGRWPIPPATPMGGIWEPKRAWMRARPRRMARPARTTLRRRRARAIRRVWSRATCCLLQGLPS